MEFLFNSSSVLREQQIARRAQPPSEPLQLPVVQPRLQPRQLQRAKQSFHGYYLTKTGDAVISVARFVFMLNSKAARMSCGMSEAGVKKSD